MGFQQRLKGWLVDVVVVIVVVAAGGYSLTSAVQTAVAGRGARVAPFFDLARAGHGGSPPSAPATPRGVLAVRAAPLAAAVRGPFEVMASRNLLGLAREDLRRPPQEPSEVLSESSVVRSVHDGDLQPCSIPAKLLGTVVVEELPQWSIAVLRSTQTGESQTYTVNPYSSQITDDAELMAIRRGEIVVRRLGQYERCLLDDTAHRGVVNSSSVSGVTKTGTYSFRIEETHLEDVLSQLEWGGRQLDWEPQERNGSPHGVEVSSIRPGSIYATMGLREGDIIQTVNGRQVLLDADVAELIPLKLEDAGRLTLAVRRVNRPIVLSYAVQ